MTEREKMLAGELYDCGDAELLTQWHKAKDLIRGYNQVSHAFDLKQSLFSLFTFLVKRTFAIRFATCS